VEDSQGQKVSKVKLINVKVPVAPPGGSNGKKTSMLHTATASLFVASNRVDNLTLLASIVGFMVLLAMIGIEKKQRNKQDN